MQITTDEDWAENEELISAWIKVLESVVDKVAPKYVLNTIVEPVKNLLHHSNSFSKRKLGNRILFSVAKHTGEKFFNTYPIMLKLIQ